MLGLALRFPVILAVWTALAALLARRRVVTFERGVGSLGLGGTFAEYFVIFSVRALLTMPALALARRFPLRRGALGRAAPVHAAGAIAFAITSRALQRLAFALLGWPATALVLPVSARFEQQLGADFLVEVVVYWAIVGVWHVADLNRRSRERALRAARLEMQAAQLREGLATAQLDTLRAQLNPHFLFNTLNSISVLMTEDVAAANQMLLRLADLLRASLTTAATQEVELGQELDFLRGYVEIEQARLQDRLAVRIEVDPAALDARVPSMILQPLVENAIRHGIAPRVGPGTIEIRAARAGGHLELQICDDGRGMAAASKPGLGLGLSTTRARLERLYGRAHRFDLSDGERGGLVVSISIAARGSR